MDNVMLSGIPLPETLTDTFNKASRYKVVASSNRTNKEGYTAHD
jgi:hypothetical protein